MSTIVHSRKQLQQGDTIIFAFPDQYFDVMVTKKSPEHLYVSFEVMVDDYEEGDPDSRFDLGGYIKWDGCVNFSQDHFFGVHYCGPEDFELLHIIMQCAYKGALELMPERGEFLDHKLALPEGWSIEEAKDEQAPTHG